jgi:hypothetical protein
MATVVRRVINRPRSQLHGRGFMRMTWCRWRRSKERSSVFCSMIPLCHLVRGTGISAVYLVAKKCVKIVALRADYSVEHLELFHLKHSNSVECSEASHSLQQVWKKSLKHELICLTRSATRVVPPQLHPHAKPRTDGLWFLKWRQGKSRVADPF